MHNTWFLTFTERKDNQTSNKLNTIAIPLAATPLCMLANIVLALSLGVIFPQILLTSLSVLLTYFTPKGNEILGCKRGCYAVLGRHVVLRSLSNSAMPCRSILNAASSSRWWRVSLSYIFRYARPNSLRYLFSIAICAIDSPLCLLCLSLANRRPFFRYVRFRRHTDWPLLVHCRISCASHHRCRDCR